MEAELVSLLDESVKPTTVGSAVSHGIMYTLGRQHSLEDLATKLAKILREEYLNASSLEVTSRALEEWKRLSS